MQNEGFFWFFIVVAGISFVMGFLLGWSDQRGHYPYEMMLIQQEMMREELRHGQTGRTMGIVLFIIVVLIVVTRLAMN
jgi:hypothetical protein